MNCMVSPLLARIELQLLMNLTARALQQPAERIWTLSGADALRAYADYTSRHLQGGVSEQLWQRMNSEAYRMGCRLRRLCLLRHKTTAQRMVVWLYQHIGIDVRFVHDDELCFYDCYFSRFYTPAVCRAASALDDGIIRGIIGMADGRLHFSHRLTEGCNCCKATIKTEPNKNINI